MPLYFFHVREDSEIRDDHGIFLADEHTAKHHGVMMLGRILHDEPQAFWASGQIRVTATKEDGVVLFTLETTAELSGASSKGSRHVQQLFPPTSPISGADGMAADPRQRRH